MLIERIVAGEPAQFGPLSLRNHLVMAPMVTLFPEVADRPTQHHVSFYAKRARGGAGLVIVGAAYVSPDGRGFPNQMGIDDDGKVPLFGRLAEAIQLHAPAMLQLFHAGPKTSRSLSGRDVVGASGLPSAGARYEPTRPLTTAEVATVVTAFEAAAIRAYDAGFRGVEVHGANGYLLHTFSDPTANRRRDCWGRPDALPVEVVCRLRRRLPSGFLVGYTLSPFPRGGRDVADARSLGSFVDLARHLVAAGVNYIHVYRGKAEPQESRGVRVFAATLRQAGLAIPIVEGAGIRSATDADVFLRQGATLAAVGRALLARPDLLGSPRHEFPASDLAALSTSSSLRRAFAWEYAGRPLDDAP